MQPTVREPIDTLSQLISIDGGIDVRTDAADPADGSAYKVLIMEGNRPLARLLSKELIAESLAADVAYERETAMKLLDATTYNLLILDLNLTEPFGLQMLQQAPTRWPLTRILALSSQVGIDSLVTALDQGADDYLPKPFSILEMMARIRAIRRRTYPATGVTPAPKVNAIVLHKDRCQVERDGRTIDLTPREFTLLEYLMQNPGKTLSRASLSQDVWNMEFDPNTNIVDVYIKYLRDKIDQNERVKLIRTVRGLGYAFMCPT